MTSPTALLSMRGFKKRFGATIVLDSVNLQVASGKVLALVGENGAGKSTLMKVLAALCHMMARVSAPPLPKPGSITYMRVSPARFVVE